MKKILIFGETIIDKYDNYEVVAGAPLNVAINLKKKNVDPYLLSAIGKDTNGKKIINFLKKNNLNLDFIEQKKFLKTGSALISQKNNSNSFKIGNYFAWDEIETVPNFTPYLLYTGSIISRSEKTLKTLKKILQKNIKYIYFDLNLRRPYVNWDFISYMIKNKITHLKLTDGEYKYIKKKSNNDFKIKNLFKLNNKLEFIALTKGSKGSEIILKNNINLKYNNDYKKKVVNSVGAGDVFSANLILGIVKSENLIDSYLEAVNASIKSISKMTIY